MFVPEEEPSAWTLPGPEGQVLWTNAAGARPAAHPLPGWANGSHAIDAGAGPGLASLTVVTSDLGEEMPGKTSVFARDTELL